MGAEIIKVEAPGQPDPIRDWGKARYEGRSLWWPVQSRNKKCVTLNLRHERGQELLLELVKRADVVTENFRPGTLERWNLGCERLQRGEPAARPRPDLGVRPDRARTPSAPASPRSPRRWAGSATSTASRASRRRGCTSRSATRSPGCSPCRASSRRSTGATRSAAAAGRSSTSRCMESCFALLESAVPEYDRLGIVRGPRRHGPQGHRAVEHLQVERRQVDGDRGERGQGLPAAVRGDRAARARRRPEVRDPPRPRREPGGARGHRSRDWATRAHGRGDRPRSSTTPA